MPDRARFRAASASGDCRYVGGARMQESIFSLMQMARHRWLSTAARGVYSLYRCFDKSHHRGVTASIASLGDIIIAEPNALIGFAGPRVIEQTIGRTLPVGAQKAEILLKHGMIDCIVRRC